MNKLGIIGGIAPPSTIEYYKLLTNVFHQKSNGTHFPNLVINSVDLHRVLPLLQSNNVKDLAKLLVEEIKVLKRAGCSLVGISSNANHIAINQVIMDSPLPVLSIIDAVRDEAISMNLRRLGLIGTKFVMEMKIYKQTFDEANLELLIPDLKDQDFIHDKYLEELILGNFNSKTKSDFIQLLSAFQKDKQLDGVILGGTELPILLNREEIDSRPLLNTTSIHVRALLNAWAL